MKYKGNKNLIVYVLTYGSRSTRSPLGDTAPFKNSPPKISKKLIPWKIYHFKILQPPPPSPSPNIRESPYLDDHVVNGEGMLLNLMADIRLPFKTAPKLIKLSQELYQDT